MVGVWDHGAIGGTFAVLDGVVGTKITSKNNGGLDHFTIGGHGKITAASWAEGNSGIAGHVQVRF